MKRLAAAAVVALVIVDTVPGDACTAWIYQSPDPSTPVSAAVTFTAT